MNKIVNASIVQFQKNEESLLIKVVICNNDVNMTEQCFNIIRSYHYLRKLNRISVSQVVESFPTKTFRKLFNYETSWINNCSQAPFTLRKSIITSEKWLNLILTSFDLKTLYDIVDDDLYRIQKSALIIRKQIEKRPRQLQQFFASSSNIEILMKHAKIECKGIDQSDDDDVVYIEPSCGDGRIMKKLLESGATHVIGIDIDPEVSNLAKYHINHAIDNNSFNPHPKVNFFVQDFLISKKKDLLLHSNIHTEKQRIVVIGGPPFSIIPSNISTTTTTTTSDTIAPTIIKSNSAEKSFDYSSSQRCDYPLLFLIHSAIELQAIRIIFILPERCNSLDFIRQATNGMQDKTTNTSWRLLHSIKADSSFMLLDREIKQPAIIQVWERN